jgi:chromosome partitioning protein
MSVVLAVVGVKGGVGKSTLAVHVAARALERGLRCIVVDADPAQDSSRWLAEAAPDVHVERATATQDLLRIVPTLRTHADLIVIDGAGSDGELTRAAMLRADAVALPCGPSLLDLRALRDTLDLLGVVQDIRNGAPRALIVPTRWTATRVAGDVAAAMAQLGVPIAKNPAPQRAAIADAAGQGTVAWKNAAAGEAGEAMLVVADALLDHAHATPKNRRRSPRR